MSLKSIHEVIARLDAFEIDEHAAVAQFPAQALKDRSRIFRAACTSIADENASRHLGC